VSAGGGPKRRTSTFAKPAGRKHNLDHGDHEFTDLSGPEGIDEQRK